MVEKAPTQPKNSYAGRYKIIKTLGEGGFGVVKQAELEGTEEKFALKFIKSEVLKRADIRNEIDIMSKLNHPNIIKLVEHFNDLKYVKPNRKTLERFTIVTELAEKGCFIEYLKISRIVFKRGFPESFARRYFHQLISALEYCHNLGIVHRDIKPDNLLLDSNYNLKVTDFGWAALIDKHQTALLKTNVGTSSYQPPEMIKGEWYDGKAADVFSAGIVLFQMILGVSPFGRAISIDSFYRYIWNGEISKFWATHESRLIEGFTLKSELKTLINALLTPLPEERLTIPQIKESDWYNGKVAEEKDLKLEFDQYQMPLSQITQIEKEKRQQEKKKKLDEIHWRDINLTTGVFSGNYDTRDSELGKDLEKTLQELNLKVDFSATRDISIYDATVKKPATTFFSMINENLLFKKLVVIADTLEGECSVSDKKFKIKVEVTETEKHGPLRIQIEIFKIDEFSNCIEFTKKYGEYQEFLDFIYSEIKPRLTDLIEDQEKL